MGEENPGRIYTIGHSNRTLGEFLEVLKHYGIAALADVRSYPASRRNPHFDRENLEKALEQVSIEYRWIKGLGGMRKIPYGDYINTAEFEEALGELTELARTKRTAFMCAELRWRDCHRSFISGRLSSLGREVVHIYGAWESEIHSSLAGIA